MLRPADIDPEQFAKIIARYMLEVADHLYAKVQLWAQADLALEPMDTDLAEVRRVLRAYID